MEAKAAAHERRRCKCCCNEAEALAEAKGIQAKSHAQAIPDLEIGEATAKVAKEELAGEVIAALAALKKMS